MSFIMEETTVVAGDSRNIISGSAFEFPRRPMLLTLGLTAAAAGLFWTVTTGAQLLLEESAPPVATRYPIQPDEMYLSDIVMPGDRIVVQVRNPTGGNVVVRAILAMQPVQLPQRR